MPIYEYECGACGYRLEVIQKMSDAPQVECPSCGQPELKKLVSAAGFRLSGKGWYETDFKNSNQRNLANKESTKSGDGKGAKPAQSKPGEGKGAKPAQSEAASGGAKGKAAQSGS
jgi:putative FmdB family regulatory protein